MFFKKSLKIVLLACQFFFSIYLKISHLASLFMIHTGPSTATTSSTLAAAAGGGGGAFSSALMSSAAGTGLPSSLASLGDSSMRRLEKLVRKKL
jgi:hypothetical protein